MFIPSQWVLRKNAMTTAQADRYARLTEQFRNGLRHVRGMGNLLNEAVTRSVLIAPTLETLGYSPFYRIPEYQEQGNTPDEICYLRPVHDNPGEAAIILEAKSYGTSFDKTPSGIRADSPDRQIKRYLSQHRASGPNTIGVLTDGIRWRIYRRSKDINNNDLETHEEYNFQELDSPKQQALTEFAPPVENSLTNLVELLARDQIEYRTVRHRVPKRNLADILFEAIIANPQPENILKHLLDEQDTTPQANLPQANLNEDVTLQGKRKDTHDNDWQDYAYAKSVAITTDNPALMQDVGHYAVIAAVQYKHDASNVGLSRADAALCARTFAGADLSRTAITFPYIIAPDGNIEARFAVASGNQVNMTVAFDPKLPSPSARTAINELLRTLRSADDALPADKLLEPLEVAPLRQKFYREVAKWTGDLQRGKDLTVRQAILRHLIRVIFTWILKEENIVPPELFEQAFVRVNYGNDEDKYHKEVLRFLFHQRLNIPRDMRSPHGIDTIEDAMLPTPFLNGSLFAEHADDDLLDIPASQYWNTDADNPGLFTILSRYHWTTDEHRPGESEQTLDPELLSNLFERLITPTREGTQPPLRQPKGTYYTPADVADEMVKDALAAAVRDYAPQSVSEWELLDLFGESDAEPPQMTDTQREILAERIKQLRIFDPAVGSGEFLFSMLLALQRALAKLEPDKHSATTDIIKRQLSGQDIQPLAVQIARLRLFIAIIAARKNSIDNDEPLPNLEARIVCADTLQTSADPQWRPDRPGRFDTANPELIRALTELADNRAKWFAAHTEQDKQLVLTEDARLRDRLRILLQNESEFASPELIGFAESPLYNINPEPARTDARLLFYENPWRGFDIVIGNPPYEALNKSMTREQVNAHKTNKRYQTTNVGDLYSLFCETALALANPDGGVITMVVPLSIAFGQRQRSLRRVFEHSCSEINLRHYDNIPDTIFNGTPTLKTWKNRQRASIFTAIIKDGMPVIKSTGLQGWLTSEREECLAQRRVANQLKISSSMDNRVASQWLRIPTKEVGAMAKVICEQSRSVMSFEYKPSDEDAVQGELIAFPQTAYQFIGVIPAGTVSPRRETLVRVKDNDILRLIMATLNGHVGYAWWWMVGDGFHVKPIADHGTLTIPNIWVENRKTAIDMGQKLIDAIPDCITEKLNAGTLWQNVNFHLKPELIEELDRLHLEALGFTGAKQDKLLSHLRIMRSSSSWKFD